MPETASESGEQIDPGKWPNWNMAPCPFCTNAHDQPRRLCVVSDQDMDPIMYSVECGYCETYGPRHSIEANAVRAWNTRP